MSCARGDTECVQLLSMYGASREASVQGHAVTAESIASHHPTILAWLVASRDWCSPLHHVHMLSEERTVELLSGGADLNHRTPGVANAPSPLELAHLQPVSSVAARLILCAAEPWSQCSHYLFPAHARSWAKEVLRLGYLLAFERYPMESGQLTDVWREVVLPLAVER